MDNGCEEKFELKNATIKSAKISIDNGFILTAYLDLDYGSNCQGFGGYVLAMNETATHYKDSMQFNSAGIFIQRVMEIAGVESWDLLPGKNIRVYHNHSKVKSIGHIIKDEWFNPAIDLQKIKR